MQVGQIGKQGNYDDHHYQDYTSMVSRCFEALDAPLFTTNAAGLSEAYLDGFPEDQRQHHNCRSCKDFIERFGGLVTIDDHGRTTSAVFSGGAAPEGYRNSIRAIESIVKKAKITGVFYSSDRVLGKPETGAWRHFYVKNSRQHNSLVKTAWQAMAEKKEDYRNVCVALAEFSIQSLETALKILNADALYRSEKVTGPAQWLYDLKKATTDNRHAKNNIIWKAVATAPAGFCHPRSSMVGTLLEDILAGLPFDAIARRFAAKMHPLQYLRPQAAPSDGNIAQAEKIIEALKAAGALDRRFARIDEVDALWKLTPEKHESLDSGVFGHLKSSPSPKNNMIVKAGRITWEKFRKTVLPTAKKIKVYIPSSGDFIALVSATNMDAPPIIQWDTPERRNPVSWYRYHGGSSARQWDLADCAWRDVVAACLYPGRWFGNDRQGLNNEAMFIVAGAVDTRADSLALFPEILKSELHPVRRTIEAYSRSRKLTGEKNASACGISVVGSTVRVDDVEYIIDRID